MSSTPSPFGFQESPVWQHAMTLAEHVFAKTERFPLREHAGLAAYMRDSAQRLASAIAADNTREAQALAKTLFTQATLAARLGHLATEDALAMLVDIEALSAAMTPETLALSKPAKAAPEAIEVEKPAAEKPAETKPRERAERADNAYKPRSKARPDKRAREGNKRPYGDRKISRHSA